MTTTQINLKVSYDSEVDAAYIFLKEIKKGEATNTFTLDDESGELIYDINVDLDKDLKLLGFEILDASKRLPKEIMDEIRRKIR
jgi:uncharacterized protein YuzE